MKKHTIISNLLKVFCSLFLILIVTSCEKNEYVQNFDDVFDISGVIDLNQKIDDATAKGDYSVFVEDFSIDIPAGLKDVNLDEFIYHYNKNIKLSSQEVDMLLKNDLDTYMNIVKRFGTMPTQVVDLNIDFDAVKSSSLNKYLVKQKTKPENFYIDNYYSAVIAYQDFIKMAVIDPLQKFENNSESLKSGDTEDDKVITVPPGNPGDWDPAVAAYIETVLIASNNNWEMYWVYWEYLGHIYRTKHKGAVGGN